MILYDKDGNRYIASKWRRRQGHDESKRGEGRGPIMPISVDDISRLAALIKDNWSLCEFLGNSEAEYMVAETIHAAKINLEQHGEPFSIRGAGVFACTGGGLFDNGSAYHRLLDEGLFVEDQREIDGQNVTVIFPTQKLIEKLDAFFARAQSAELETK